MMQPMELLAVLVAAGMLIPLAWFIALAAIGAIAAAVEKLRH